MEVKLSDIPNLNSAHFTGINSGKFAREAPPWHINHATKTLVTYAAWCQPIGYTLNPPFPAAWDKDGTQTVSIMYETPDGAWIWWHHMLPRDYKMKATMENVDQENWPSVRARQAKIHV